MRNFISGIVLGALVASGLAVAAPKIAGPWRVGVGKPVKAGIRAASSTTSTTPTVDWSRICIAKSGGAVVDITYSIGTTGAQSSQLQVDPGCTVVKRLSDGSTVYTTSGGSDPVCTTISGTITQVGTLISNGASGGKLNL